MSLMRTKAIVLRRTNYGEADRILQVITPEYGKVSVVARGVRREKSRLAGGVELFARSDVTMTTGKGDMAILTSARLEKFYSAILRDYDRLQFAYEAIKQISKAADQLDESAFFDLLDQTFEALNGTIDLRIVKTWFWLQLAILLGIGVNLAVDDKGEKLQLGQAYNFDQTSEVFVAHEKGRFTSDHIKILRILSAQPAHVAAQVQGMDTLIDDCLWLAERAVAH